LEQYPFFIPDKSVESIRRFLSYYGTATYHIIVVSNHRWAAYPYLRLMVKNLESIINEDGGKDPLGGGISDVNTIRTWRHGTIVYLLLYANSTEDAVYWELFRK